MKHVPYSIMRQKAQHILSVLFFSAAACLVTCGPAQGATDHRELITSYEGSKTCRQCHEATVQDVSRTIHYKLMGEVQDVYNMFTNEPEVGPQGKGNRY